MSTTVYLIGHGRVDGAAAPANVPATVTLHWLGPLGDVTAGLSYSFLNGTLAAVDSTSPPGSAIPQHYLCGEHADEDDVVNTKIKNFFNRGTPHPHGSQDPYVLYPRGKKNVSLSSIFDFLLMLSPSTDWHLYWTCCRGYIGVRNPYTTKYTKASGLVTRELRVKPDETPALHDQNHETVAAGFQTVRLVASSDRAVVQASMTRQRDFVKSETKAIETLMRL